MQRKIVFLKQQAALEFGIEMKGERWVRRWVVGIFCAMCNDALKGEEIKL